MKDWQGIRVDTDATLNDGASYVANARYEIKGEAQRRSGMSAFAPQSGILMWSFWSPTKSYQMAFATDDGQLVILETTT